ncbi:hypothetical protein ETAA8_32980 [Anatilimnocola aggregata]|uniref:Ribbon-helix-helix protein CopG domain-containing protein n=1 Tax=Anatilimnocola aggregata TaxID=2528021 RepID=A0A517YD93_9BACT|nr:hypothetical protein [Anatilimnocola aggregata]QDU28198.1 hypothetical protein ETAA8_32980 [Anatilimnocola aggregata]
MIQVNLSPDREAVLAEAAAETGSDVSEYIWQAVQARIAERNALLAPGDQRSREHRKREYRAFIEQQTSHNPNFDDSRDSIYD